MTWASRRCSIVHQWAPSRLLTFQNIYVWLYCFWCDYYLFYFLLRGLLRLFLLWSFFWEISVVVLYFENYVAKKVSNRMKNSWFEPPATVLLCSKNLICISGKLKSISVIKSICKLRVYVWIWGEIVYL